MNRTQIMAGIACQGRLVACLTRTHAPLHAEFIETRHTRHEGENFDIRTSERALPPDLTFLFTPAARFFSSGTSPEMQCWWRPPARPGPARPGPARPFACLHEGQETAMNIENRQGRATEYKYDLRAN
jgi:hypothetical protein